MNELLTQGLVDSSRYAWQRRKRRFLLGALVLLPAIAVYFAVVQKFEVFRNALDIVDWWSKPVTLFSGTDKGVYGKIGAVISEESKDCFGASYPRWVPFWDPCIADEIENEPTAGAVDNVVRVIANQRALGLSNEIALAQNDVLQSHITNVSPLYMERLHVLYNPSKLRPSGDTDQRLVLSKANKELVNLLRKATIVTEPVGSGAHVLANLIARELGLPQSVVRPTQASENPLLSVTDPNNASALYLTLVGAPEPDIAKTLSCGCLELMSVDPALTLAIAKNYDMPVRQSNLNNKYLGTDDVLIDGVSTIGNYAFLIASKDLTRGETLTFLRFLHDNKAELGNAVAPEVSSDLLPPDCSNAKETKDRGARDEGTQDEGTKCECAQSEGATSEGMKRGGTKSECITLQLDELDFFSVFKDRVAAQKLSLLADWLLFVGSVIGAAWIGFHVCSLFLSKLKASQFYESITTVYENHFLRLQGVNDATITTGGAGDRILLRTPERSGSYEANISTIVLGAQRIQDIVERAFEAYQTGQLWISDYRQIIVTLDRNVEHFRKRLARQLNLAIRAEIPVPISTLTEYQAAGMLRLTDYVSLCAMAKNETSMRIRRITVEDGGAVAAIASELSFERQRRSNHSTGFLVSEFDANDYAGLANDADHFYGIDEGGKLIAFVLAYGRGVATEDEMNGFVRQIYDADVVIVKQVAVSKSWHRRGIATLLYRHLIDVVGQRLICAAVVNDPPNNASARFHEKLGFRLDRTDVPAPDGLPRAIWRLGDRP